MKITISTIKLQEMLSKVIKGASNNRLVPITGLLSIKIKDGVLSLTTTDATNYLTVRELDVEGEDGAIVVQADFFAKLISKMTCDVITMVLTDSCLKVTGNGDFKVGLVLDDDGSLLKYPDPVSGVSKTNKIGSLTIGTIRSILNSVKPALATTMETPCYVNYFMGDCALATDTYKVSSLANKIFETPKLVSGDMVNLLSVVTDEIVDVYSDGSKLLFESDHMVLYGVESTGLENFSVELLKDLVNKHFESKCLVSKGALLQLLDRISLFVVPEYDEGEINLNFTENGLTVSSKSSTGEELLKYVDSAMAKAFSCTININLLITQVKAQVNDVIKIEFGDDISTMVEDDKAHALKITSGDITSIVALN